MSTQQCYRARSAHLHTHSQTHCATHTTHAHLYTQTQFLYVKMTQVKWRGLAHTSMPAYTDTNSRAVKPAVCSAPLLREAGVV